MVIYNPASPAGADRIRSLAKLQTSASKTAAARAFQGQCVTRGGFTTLE
jgi:hypothetical protein